MSEIYDQSRYTFLYHLNCLGLFILGCLCIDCPVEMQRQQFSMASPYL